MEELVIGSWRIKYDEQATRLAYSRILAGGSETCTCDSCKNFVAAREEIYCQKVLSIFKKLGIDYKKDVEVYQLDRIDKGLHLYGGWFHFVGDVENLSESNYVEVCNGFSWNFRNERQLSNKVFEGLPLVQIDFETTVPWVIDSDEPE